MDYYPNCDTRSASEQLHPEIGSVEGVLGDAEITLCDVEARVIVDRHDDLRADPRSGPCVIAPGLPEAVAPDMTCQSEHGCLFSIMCNFTVVLMFLACYNIGSYMKVLAGQRDTSAGTL